MLTDEEVMELLNSTTPWNRARRILSSERSRIDGSPNPIEMRRREFEAVARIVKLFGIDIAESTRCYQRRKKP